MARTRQIARRSTGGRAPRHQLAPCTHQRYTFLWRVWDAYALIESAQPCRLSWWNGALLFLDQWGVGWWIISHCGGRCSSPRWRFWVERLTLWVNWQDRWGSSWQGSFWDTKGHHRSFSSGVGSRYGWSLSEGQPLHWLMAACQRTISRDWCSRSAE
jgi:hypothetical protein